MTEQNQPVPDDPAQPPVVPPVAPDQTAATRPSDPLPVGPWFDESSEEPTTVRSPFAAPEPLSPGYQPLPPGPETVSVPFTPPPAPPIATYPGEPQMPLAVLPQSDYGPQQPPSGPFPVMPPQLPPPAPRKPRNAPMVVLTVTAIFFFLTTAALGTLWLIEIGDHKSTSSELSTAQGSLTKTKDDLKAAESKQQAADLERQKTLKDVQAMQPCYNAARALLRAASEDDAKKRFEELVNAC